MSGRRRSVLVCHEWLTTIGGSDAVAFEIARALDASRVVTAAVDRAVVEQLDPDGGIEVVALITSETVTKRHREFLPLLALKWRQLDTSAHDVVVTSSHSVIPHLRRARRDQTIVMYCHSPMRYAWRWREELSRFPRFVRPLWPGIAAGLRWADKRAAKTPDVILANSAYTQAMISSAWGRQSEILHPPIDTEYFTPAERAEEAERFFLHVGRLVAYKRPSLAIEAATRAGVRLVVAGDGPERAACEAVAGPLVEFVGEVSRSELRRLYRDAEALIFPANEDFGMTPLEAMACGTPVIAAREGGALETVVEGVTGVFCPPSVDRFSAEIEEFRSEDYRPERIRAHARSFGRDAFATKIRSIVQSDV